MGGNEHLLAQRNELRFMLTRLPTILAEDPSTWYMQCARAVINVAQRQDVLPTEMQDYLAPIIGHAINILHQEASTGSVDEEKIDEELIGQRAHANMVTLSQISSEEFSEDLERVEEHLVTIPELIDAHSDVLSVYAEEENGFKFTDINVHMPNTGLQQSFRLPLDPFSYHKGGIGRLLLKIHAGASFDLISSELPINDVDVYMISESENSGRWHAKLIGADEQGIETANGNVFDFSQYANGRDMSFNQVCLGLDGLHFSDAAYEAARTGHIDIVGHYIPDRAIYGFDRYPAKLDDEKYILAKPRGLMRYVKSLAEGKASSFDYLPVNSNLDFGIYWLVLARKWAKTPDSFPERMQKMFHICQQMGQTQENENGVMDSLSRVHTDYPYFDIEHEFEGEVGVARWIGGKLIKQLDREFGWAYDIPSGVEFTRHEGDTRRVRVSTDGFRYDPFEAQKIQYGWGLFLDASRERLKRYNLLDITPTERFFIDADMQGLPDYIRDLM